MNIDRPELTGSSRRDFFRKTLKVSAGVGLVSTLDIPDLAHAGQTFPPTVTSTETPESAQAQQAASVPWANGKYQTFPRHYLRESDADYRALVQRPDIGTLGPDVDTIFGMDFYGELATDATVVYRPQGTALETRVVGIKRTDLSYVQFNDVLGGDQFDIYQVSKFGGDPTLDAMARAHAKNSAHDHQLVVYLGDLGLFQTQWGATKPKERDFLRTIIRAQVPARNSIPDLGIPRSNFANARIF